MSTQTVSARARPRRRLVARTVPVRALGSLIGLLPAESALAWVRRGEGLVGWGETARFETAGPERFTEAQRWWRSLTGGAIVRDELGLPGCGPIAFGSFAFDDQPGSSVLVVPEVVIGCRNGQWWATSLSLGTSLPSLVPTLPTSATLPPRAPGALVFSDGAVSGAAWESIVAGVLERINAGDVEKVVLARDMFVDAERVVDLRWPLTRLARTYSACWTFHIDGLLGATPELLLRLDKGLVTSRVLAGTIRPSGDDEHDLALAASLARSSKDLEEHEYAVRSVAEALAPHCSSMNVPETPFVLHLPNVMHLASDVTGVLNHPTASLTLAAALHPSAAVCGTPTARARDLIREVEGMDRARYAGPVGWTDARGDGEWGIALRCARLDPDEPRRLRLFAGCGIVAGSDPEDELAEAAAKLVPIRDALGE